MSNTFSMNDEQKEKNEQLQRLGKIYFLAFNTNCPEKRKRMAKFIIELEPLEDMKVYVNILEKIFYE